MFQSKCKSLILAVVLLGILAMSAAETQAGWWHRWGHWGYPSYSWYSGYSGWYVGLRPGPVYRWAYRPYRWYRGYGCGWGSCYGGPYYATSYCGSYCSPCYSSCCCCSPCYSTCCCYDPCCGSTVTTYSTPTVAPVAPVAPKAVAPAPTPAPLPQLPAPTLPQTPVVPKVVPKSVDPQTKSPLSADGGLLTIRVPAEARVYVNGYKTKSTGAVRQYVSNGLKPGFSYKYEIRAEMVRDGRLVEDTQVIYLRAGATEHVVLSFDATPAQRLATIW